MNKALSIFNQLRPLSVGFDDVFDTFESFFDSDLRIPTINYPPYNIVKTGKNAYDIEVALAGILTIESKMSDKDESKDEDGNTIYKGISKRYFKRSFTIANDVEIKGAELKDGLLKVSMEKIVPESKKLKTIEIK
jgi:molecular chaperone IbpA